MALLAYPLMWVARLWPAIGVAQVAMLLNPILTAWTGGLLFRQGDAWAGAGALSTAVPADLWLGDAGLALCPDLF